MYRYQLLLLAALCLTSSQSLGDLPPDHQAEINSLIDNWLNSAEISESGLLYIRDVDRKYEHFLASANKPQYEEVSLRRSFWAKKMMKHLQTISLEISSLDELLTLYLSLEALHSLISPDFIDQLVVSDKTLGNAVSKQKLFRLLAEHGDPDHVYEIFNKLGAPAWANKLLGPQRIKKFRPIRKSGRFSPDEWLQDPTMQALQFVDGNPDRVRYRGLTLESGDIGLVRLNHYGDGILGSFLEEPGPLPHAFLYLTRRIKDKQTGEILFQPSIIEIFEGGWRSIPLTTALHPKFIWYSEWMRPQIDGKNLGPDLGKKLNQEIDKMEIFAFDFLARRVPESGYYEKAEGGSCATCTNLVRVPFVRAGFSDIPYPTTKVYPGARANLERIGLGGIDEIHTPTDILLHSGYERVGIIDNGFPEESYAQALVVGRPEVSESFGGWFSQRKLVSANLPQWSSVGNISLATQALIIKIGQSDSIVASGIRKSIGVSSEEVPKSASASAIVFYLSSETEAAHIVKESICPEMFRRFRESMKIPRIDQLRRDPRLAEIIKDELDQTKLAKQKWYKEKN